MSLVTKKELISIKLNSIPLPLLKELALKIGLSAQGNGTDLKNRLAGIDENTLDKFIKEKYKDLIIEERRKVVSDEDLIKELNGIKDFKWTSVQGALDQKIQVEYVRKYFRYLDLVSAVKNQLQTDILSYVTASWFNHWTTRLIEDHISEHKNIVPTLKNNFGVDVFFRNQPFDLKVTYVPQGYSVEDALKNPRKLAIWMYEKQGEQRFGSDNRFFVVVKSWEVKRDFSFIYKKIDEFLENSDVTEKDEIQFTFKGNLYTTTSKILVLVK